MLIIIEAGDGDSLHYSMYFCACSKFFIIKKFKNAQIFKNILKQISQNGRWVCGYLIYYYLYFFTPTPNHNLCGGCVYVCV